VPDLHFEHPRLATVYDAGGWSADRDFHLAQADSSRERILDFGCGTVRHTSYVWLHLPQPCRTLRRFGGGWWHPKGLGPVS
jgi:hypothetical protein